VLVYDAWNRPVKVYVDADEGRDPDAGELLATYEYDGQKRRIVETIEGEPDVTRDSYYSDAWQVIEVHEGGDADNPLKQFVWDPRYVDSPIVRFHDGNTDGDYLDAEDDVLYYTTDANFNVTAVVDTSGAVVERYAYDPYGQGTILNGADGADPDVDGETVFEWDPDADGASDVDNRTLYAGYHLDTETGLYSVRNRMYHPTLGRWITRDPGGYADGVNFYEYVGGFPTRALDPSGLKGRVNVGELTTEAVVEEKQCKQAGPDPGVIQRLIDWIRGDEFCCEYSGYTKYETRQSSALEGYWIVRGREPGRGKWIYEQTEVKRFWQYSDLVIFPFGWPVTEYSEYGVYERSYARAYYLVCEYECCNTRTNELETRTKETSTFYERAGTETVTEATGRTKPDIRHTRRQSIEGNRVVGPGDPHPLDEGAPGPAVWPPLPPPGGPPPIVGP
ncbi:MAG: RHS repeat-associated core domain-containing protein, partial [Phycisphaerae bacterium]